MEEFLITVVALFLLIVPPIDWTVFYFLQKAYRKTNGKGIALKERAVVAGILACATTINAALAAFRLLGIRVPPEVGITLLLASLVLVSLPNLYWAISYYRLRQNVKGR